MIKTEQFNHISPQLEKEFSIRPGEVKVFKYTKMKRDPHPESQTGWFMPMARGVLNQVMIWDPYLEETVQIAAIRRIKPNGEPEFQSIFFNKQDGLQIACNGDSAEDRNLYTFLMLHPDNESNPYRPSNSNPFFKLEVPEEEAKQRRSMREIRFSALQSSRELTQQRVRTIAAALGHSPMADIMVLREVVEAYAEENPQQYLNLAGGKDTDVMAKVNMAFQPKINILRYLARNRKVVWSETKGTVLTVPPGKKHQQAVFEKILNSEDGQAILHQIEVALEDKLPGEPVLASDDPAVKKEGPKKKPASKKTVGVVKTSD